MIGTWVNVGGILLGAVIGVLLGRGIPERIRDSVLQIEGLAILLIGLNGVLGTMLRVDPVTGRISDQGGLLLLVSLVLGDLLGEALRIDERINRWGEWVERKLGAQGFSRGFVAASLVFSIGAMSVVGSINDGLRGDTAVLLIKSALDFTTSIILASSLGIGVAFSALPVLLLQGSISLLASSISDLITEPLLEMFCMVGYAIVLSIGLNFLCNTRIKTANLLPALIVPVIYYFVRY